MVRILISAMFVMVLWTPATATVAAPPVFRIGYLSTVASPCQEPDASSPAGLRAYVRHLSVRLGRSVQACAFASTEEATLALVEGRVDFAPLSATASPERATIIRPLLTPRASNGVGRVLTVLVSKNNAPFDSLTKAAGARVVLGGPSDVARAGPLRALADNGVAEASLGAQTIAASTEAAANVLRTGGADLMLLHAAAWQRLCRGDRPNEKPCADLREVWRGRPSVDAAWAVRRDITDDLRLRVVGIHVAMHLEAPEAFGWIAPGAGEVQPVEATARVRAPVRP